jgi:ribonuclease HII
MIYPTLSEEDKLWKQGKKLVCGIDEVGRGCFAGPVVVGAVIFPVNSELIEGVADSKLLSAKSRELLAVSIQQKALCWAIAEVDVATINQIGIGKATQMAFLKVIQELKVRADFVLIDAFRVQGYDNNKQEAIVDGDTSCFSIAAASIIAKVYRDSLMQKLHQEHPEYGWDKNKGYGTKSHREAMKKHGLTKYHRLSFNLEKFL